MKRFVGFLIIFGLLLSLAAPLTAQDQVYYPTTEWHTSTSEAQGMDLAALADFIQKVPTLGAVDSVMIIRNGYVVAEAYWHPFAQGMKHELMSASKSVISALVGIAIDKGYLKSIDQKVLDFFPEVTVSNLDANKPVMTIRDLLTMTSGFDCEIMQGITDPAGDLLTRPDATAFGLGWPMADAPGSTFHYCQINPYLLSAILTKSTGMDTLAFAKQYLFTPLGISDVGWNVSAEGVALGFVGLKLNTQDMAKIGYLFLNNGRWGNTQIVPADWVSQSTQTQVNNPWGLPNFGYGYLWWTVETPSDHFYEAEGAYFQRITVASEKNLVVAVTGIDETLNEAGYASPDFMTGILNTVKSDTALPVNSQGEAYLQAAEKAAANPKTQPLAGLPALATQISGKTFRLENPDLLLREADVNGLPAEDWQMATLALDFGQDSATLKLQAVSGAKLNIPVGLDGIYRVTSSPLGTLAARGHWLNDARFQFDVRRLDQGPVLAYDLIFSNREFTGTVASARSGDWYFFFPIQSVLRGEIVN